MVESADMGHVLVVDDDAAIRESVAELLIQDGHRVQTCENGCRALAAIQQAWPTAIVLDLMMPVMDGWTVMANLRQHHPAVLKRLIIMTAGLATPPRGVQLLRKPFSRQQLLAAVRKHVLETRFRRVELRRNR